jgi:uncharacterized protein YggU (UPF0235/DUF167 family)
VAYDGQTLLVDVAAPPIDNRANDELIRTVAESIDVPKSRIRIIKGQGARSKLLEIELEPSALQRWLADRAAKVLPDC